MARRPRLICSSSPPGRRAMPQRRRACLPLADLTSLSDSDTDAGIETLCARAIDAGVAAVCVWPQFVPLAKARLERNGIRVATVANFPGRVGRSWRGRRARPPRLRSPTGAEEVGVVAPIQAILDERPGAGDGAGPGVPGKRRPGGTLKVILETGRLAEPARIAAAARAAVMGGCRLARDVDRQSSEIGATLEAAAVLLAVLEEAEGRVGHQALGRHPHGTQQAAPLSVPGGPPAGPGLDVARRRCGSAASALLEDLLRWLQGRNDLTGDDPWGVALEGLRPALGIASRPMAVRRGR